MKMILVTSSDHHSGPAYDRCLLAEDAVDVDALCEVFLTEYPIACPDERYSPGDDLNHQCEKCWARRELSERKALASGLLVDGGGFWHMTFADWLVKVKGLTLVEFDTCSL